MAITDRYGLEVTTSPAVAAEGFQDGMDKLLSYGARAEVSLAVALQADEGLAVAHAGVALLALVDDDAIRLVRRRLQHRASPRDLVWLDRASTGLAVQRGTTGESP